MIEFPTIDKTREWDDSPEYAEPRALRFRSAVSRLVLADGFQQSERPA